MDELVSMAGAGAPEAQGGAVADGAGDGAAPGVRAVILARMQAIARDNAALKERIAVLDAERTQLALTSQQQQGAYEALSSLRDALPED